MPRRRPKQARASARRESLLVAAAQLLATGGYESLTTTAIAAEANTSVGTVYDYFRNKEEVLAALLDRYQTRLGAVLSEALADVITAPLDAVVEQAIRAFATFYQEEPGYAELWLGSQLMGPLRDAGARWGTGFATMIAGLLEVRLRLHAADANPIAIALVHAVSAVVSAALTVDGESRARLIDEAVRIAQGHLDRVATECSTTMEGR